ncbi:MAG: phospho-N-acetylmuramoyl-pentapeptide-transferase [Pseudomonadota bacterium]|nr:phospho-N-acetylmuramoyl-pentapeptide-transferase [Pseudomonadota bacterium]
MRAFFAGLTSFFMVFLLMPWFIEWLKSQSIGQFIQDDGPAHALKKNIPTMAGVGLVVAVCVNSLCYLLPGNRLGWLVLSSMFLHMLVGMVDDISKIYYKNNDRGLRPRQKLLLQVLICGLTIFLWRWYFVDESYSLVHIKWPLSNVSYHIDLGYGYIVFLLLMLLGSTNSVNITDGLDGLVSVPIVQVAFGLSLYILGLKNGWVDAPWLPALYLQELQELLIVLASLIGTCLAFLWYNCYPAKIFMGDSGSLSFGAVLATVAMALKAELLFGLMAGLFIIEAFSVIIQVLYYKYTKKRFFKMAPIHHHFEILGWHEVTVVIRFWLIGLFFLCISTIWMM